MGHQLHGACVAQRDAVHRYRETVRANRVMDTCLLACTLSLRAHLAPAGPDISAAAAPPLQTKKRYVGFLYESPGQAAPVFDAKGIETVRWGFTAGSGHKRIFNSGPLSQHTC